MRAEPVLGERRPAAEHPRREGHRPLSVDQEEQPARTEAGQARTAEEGQADVPARVVPQDVAAPWVPMLVSMRRLVARAEPAVAPVF